MQKKKTKIPSQSYQNRSLPVSAERLVNMYFEKASPTSKSEFVIHGSCGLKAFTDLGTNAPVYGIHAFGNYVYAVSDNKVYKVDSLGGSTLIGSLSAGTYNNVQIVDNGVDVVVLNNQTGVAHIVTETTVTEITNPDFKSASSVTYLDGYLIFSEAGTSQFFISGLRDSNSYNALDFATAEASPDNIVRVFAGYKLLYLFGETSTEIWWDSGNADFPFETYQSGAFQRGCGAVLSVGQINNIITWLGEDGFVYAIQADSSASPIKISSHAMDDAIRKYSTISDAVAQTYSKDGHYFYELTFPTADATWCCDVAVALESPDYGAWHELKSYGMGRHRTNDCTFAFGKFITCDFENGKLYELDLDTYTDNGDTIERIGVIPPIFNDKNPIFLDRLEFDFEPGVGLNSGQGINPLVSLRRSVDGGINWGNRLYAEMGRMGERRKVTAFRKCGTANNMTYEFTITDPVKVSLAGIYAIVSGGES
jgi:hypothetical protein